MKVCQEDRWVTYLLGLERSSSDSQYKALSNIWGSLSCLSNIKYPLAGRYDDGTCYWTWKYPGSNRTFSLNVNNKGEVDWFYREEDGSVLGSDIPAAEITDEAISLLIEFIETAFVV